MLTQLKAKELILLIQDGFQVLTVFAANPDLIDSLKSELNDLKQLVSGQELNEVLVLVQKLDNLLKVITQNPESNTPAFTAENLQFIFEALHIVSHYLESGIPPRGISVSDMACVLDILYQDKVATAGIHVTQSKANSSPEENQKTPLILKVDTIKETILQNLVTGNTTNQITEEVVTEPIENESELLIEQNEERQKSVLNETEKPKSFESNESTEPQIESINSSTLEASEPIVETENEPQALQPSQSDSESLTVSKKVNQEPMLPPDNGQILIAENLEGPPAEEIQTPLSLEQILEISEPDSLPTDSDHPLKSNPIHVEIDEQAIVEHEETQIEPLAEQIEIKEISQSNDSEASSLIEAEDKIEVESINEPEQPIEINHEQMPVDIEDSVSNIPEIKSTEEPAEETVNNYTIEDKEIVEPSEENKDKILSNEEYNQIQTELPMAIEHEEETLSECSLEPLSSPLETEEPIQESQINTQEMPSNQLDSIEVKSVTSLDTPCLIIKINHQAFALPYYLVDKVDKFGLSDLKLVKNDIVTNINGKDIPMFDLAAALGYNSKDDKHEKETFLAAICRTNGKSVAILFDDIVSFEPLKINTFNTIIGKMKGIAGYSVYQNGNKQVEGQELCQLVLVIELAELI